MLSINAVVDFSSNFTVNRQFKPTFVEANRFELNMHCKYKSGASNGTKWLEVI